MGSDKDKITPDEEKGIENIALKTDDIVNYYTRREIVFVIDKEGKNIWRIKSWQTGTWNWITIIFPGQSASISSNIGFIKSYKIMKE